jgi:large subunit ribosomal protein L23
VDDYNIIIKPLVTEQGMHFANTKNAYSFEVNKKANKVQIRSAVERLYSVKVTDVRTANRTMGMTKSWKKAVVVLHEDYHIDLF